MPSHNSRLKSRRALSGDDAGDATASGRPRKSKTAAVQSGEPGRLRRLLALLLVTTTLLIIYLIYAQRSARKATRDLKRNTRTKRILLSLLTLVSWIVAIICAALLVVQYGVFTTDACVDYTTTHAMLSELNKAVHAYRELLIAQGIMNNFRIKKSSLQRVIEM